MRVAAGWILCGLVACLFVGGAYGMAEDNDETATKVGYGTIYLLDGYVHKKLQGIDTSVGHIENPKGTQITYDIGPLAGNYAGRAKNADDVVWYRKSERSGHVYEVARSDRGYAVVTVDGVSNFSAKIDQESDLADLLMIALSYTPSADAPKAGGVPARGR